jgi:hypothetical protein
MHHTATSAAGSVTGRLDHHPQPVRPVADSNHVHVGQADQQRAHTRNISFKAGAPRNSTTSASLRLAKALWRARDQPRTITQPSDAENPFSLPTSEVALESDEFGSTRLNRGALSLTL